ncbi:MAG: hypothetical protein AB7F75_07180 [Planctomycetota bacterium]
MLMGLVIVLMIAGMVAGYLMTTLSRGKNVEAAGDSQKALYVAEAGMNKARNLLAQKDASIPVAENAEYFFSSSLGDGTYYVTVTRKSATAVGADPGSNAEFVGSYEVVSTGIVEDSRKSLIGVVELEEGAGGNAIGLDGILFAQENLTLGNGDASKSMSISGSAPTVHSNADINVNITANTTGEINAVEDLDIVDPFILSVNGAAQSSASYESAHSDKAVVSLPAVNAAEFEDVAEYKLMASGEHEGQILVVSSGTYVAPEPMGWRYGYTTTETNSTTTTSTTYDNTSVMGQFKGGILCGKALDLQGNVTGQGITPPASSSITLPTNCRLTVTYKGSSASYVSGFYYIAGNNAPVMVYADSSTTDLNTTLSSVFPSGTQFRFYIRTTGGGSTYNHYENSRSSTGTPYCLITEISSTKWRYEFEDIDAESGGTPDWDYNDQIVEVEIVPTEDAVTAAGGTFSAESVGAHTNANGQIQGSVSLAGHFNCSGTLTKSGNPSAGGSVVDDTYCTAHSNRAQVEIPQYTADNFLSAANFRMYTTGSNAGKIKNLATNAWVTISSSGWTYKSTGSGSPKFQLTGTPASGIYYCDGNIEVKSSATITIVAKGDITFGAGVTMTPAPGSNLLLLSNKDIQSTANNNLTGIIYAGEEISIGGTTTITGQIVARGGASASSTATSNYLGGNVTVNFRSNLVLPTNSATGAPITTTETVTETTETYHATGWELFDADAAEEGFYFGDCGALISADVGTGADPFAITLCLTGSLRITGEVVLEPSEEDLTLLADDDIKLEGTASTAIEGLILAGEQFEFTGGCTFTGLVVSAGQANTDGLVSVNSMTGSYVLAQSGDELNLPDTDGVADMNADLAQKRDATGSPEEDANLDNFGL